MLVHERPVLVAGHRAVLARHLEDETSDEHRVVRQVRGGKVFADAHQEFVGTLLEGPAFGVDSGKESRLGNGRQPIVSASEGIDLLPAEAGEHDEAVLLESGLEFR